MNVFSLSSDRFNSNWKCAWISEGDSCLNLQVWWLIIPGAFESNVCFTGSDQFVLIDALGHIRERRKSRTPAGTY